MLSLFSSGGRWILYSPNGDPPSWPPVDPCNVDPPIEIGAEEGASVQLELPNFPSGAQINVYINAVKYATLTIGNAGAQVSLDPSIVEGHYALAVDDAATGTLRVTRILTVGNPAPLRCNIP